MVRDDGVLKIIDLGFGKKIEQTADFDRSISLNWWCERPLESKRLALIGRWDGDTLVVDTGGFHNRLWFDFAGHPQTDRLHVVERYTRRDLGTLENAVTNDDPGAYSRPFTVTFRAFLVPGTELMEFVCNENNTIPQRLRGTAAEAGQRD